MTINEAIAHCKEKSNCSECGKEHEQLAVWLAELQRYKNLKEQGRLIEMPCDDESEKYRWHDLRKNPDDLPKDSNRNAFYDWLLLRLDCGKVYSGWFRNDDKCFYIEDGCGGRYTNRVIAWREIEPFEEV